MKYAVIIADLNSSDLGEVVSTHRTEEAAYRSMGKVSARGAYVARMKPCGEWERRLEARDRIERCPQDQYE